ncbi:MAG: helix-turn-helix domain-containing protein [Paludibacteraceae bacterium]|nr:helix-turn-helix domain-containing protein [Paludibacteraceae bacterium]
MADKQILSELQKLKDLTLLSVKTALTMEDVVNLTGLKKSHIYKLVHYKRIPYYKSEGGKFTYFRKSEIEDWLLAHRVPTADEVEQQVTNYVESNKRRANI